MWLKPYAAIKELVDEINKFSGYFIFIWYNNTITGHKYKKWEKPFHSIVFVVYQI